MGLQNTIYSPGAIPGAQKTFSVKVVFPLLSVISYLAKYSSGCDISDQKRTPAAFAKLSQTARSLSATLPVMYGWSNSLPFTSYLMISIAVFTYSASD